MPRYILPILLLLSLGSCTDDAPANPDGPLPIVIEGWIEDGEHPIVIITRAVDLTGNIDSFDKYVEKWCRVTVSDDTRSEILVTRINNNYTPSLIYTSLRMRGTVGGTYTLKIETETETYEAITTIPSPVRIDSLRAVPASDGRWRVQAYPRIDPSEANRYYKFFTRTTDDRRYYSSFLGTFESAVYDPAAGYTVNRGIHDTFSEKFSPLYESGDTVRVKLCAITDDSFRFWNAYENTVSLGGNMFFNVSQGCPSNIPGAKGYWAGYGTSLAWVPIP